MRTLVIETATAICAVALFDDDHLVANVHENVGRGHAERLIPMVAALPDGGRADAILVGCGPGSFTGVRIGIATAKGLALGWGATVHGFSTLALLAAAGFAAKPGLNKLGVAIEGGHGELFVQSYENAPFAEVKPLASLAPDAATLYLAGLDLVGNAAVQMGQIATITAPDATLAIALPAALRKLAPSPIYGRAPDAKPMPI